MCKEACNRVRNVDHEFRPLDYLMEDPLDADTQLRC